MDHKWVRITPDNMHLFNKSMNNYKWIDSSVGKSLYVPFSSISASGQFINLLSKEPDEDMTIHFGFRVTKRVSMYIIPFSLDGFNYAGRTHAQLRLHQNPKSETEAMAMTFWNTSLGGGV